MKEIHIDGIGGLGNCIFQIVTAIHYAEKYGYEIILNDSSGCLQMGTIYRPKNRLFKRDTNEMLSYKNTMFKNPKLIYKQLHGNNYIVIHNNTTDNKIIPDENNYYLKIEGYCQNFNLFIEYKEKIPSYFNLNDSYVYEYVMKKYNIKTNEKNIMIGMRLCDDFKHMTKITNESYKKALYTIVSEEESDYNIIILSDIENGKINFDVKGRVIIVDEDDISQFYAGLLCNYFILSESTYHYWIAMFKNIMDENSKVIVFNDTDMTNKKLALPSWIHINY